MRCDDCFSVILFISSLSRQKYFCSVRIYFSIRNKEHKWITSDSLRNYSGTGWRCMTRCSVVRCKIIPNITHTTRCYIGVQFERHPHSSLQSHACCFGKAAWFTLPTPARAQHWPLDVSQNIAMLGFLHHVLCTRRGLEFFCLLSRKVRWKRKERQGREETFSKRVFPSAGARRSEDENWEGFLLLHGIKRPRIFPWFVGREKRRKDGGVVERTYMKGDDEKLSGDAITLFPVLLSTAFIAQ